jgi:histidinol-phosphate aminotransferase
VPYKTIKLKEDFTIDVNDYFNQKSTIFIANPNAPTGINLSLDKIKSVLINNKDNIVVIDEAYVDFGGESAVKLTHEYDNLLVTRTFSKSRSMAGARLGFGVANEKLIADLNTVKYSTNPYNVNRLTEKLGIISIKDDKYFTSCVNEIVRVREKTIKELNGLGFFTTETKTNFIFAKSDKIDGETLYKKLKEKGILVRYFSSERIKEFVRISVGTEKQMNTLIKAIKEILGE